MGRSVIAFIVLALASPALAGPPSLLWAQPYAPASGGKDKFGGAAVDPSGNINVLYVDDARGLHIARYTPAGGLLPAIDLSSNPVELDYNIKLLIDAAGNFVVGGRGYESGTEALGAAKYSPAGTFLWSKLDMASGNMDSQAAALDGAGDIYVIGGTQGGPPNTSRIVKISSAGTLLWSVSVCDMAQNNTSIGDVAGDPTTGFYVCGWTGDYGSINPGFDGGFIRKYDAGGNIQWTWTTQPSMSGVTVSAGFVYGLIGNGDRVTVVRVNAGTGAFAGEGQSDGGFSDMIPGGIAADGGGVVYVGGVTLTAPGQRSAFMIRFAPGPGSTVWSQVYNQGIHESGYERECDILLDGGGKPIMANSTGEPMTGGCGGGCGFSYDILVRSMDPGSGTQNWFRQYDSAPKAQTGDLATDVAGNSYLISGSTRQLVKYNSAGTQAWTRAYSSTSYCLNDMRRVAEAMGKVYLPAEASITRTYCGNGNDQRAVVVAIYDSAGNKQPELMWQPPWGWGDSRPGPVAINGAGDVFLGAATRTETGGSKVTYQTVVRFTNVGTVAWSRTVVFFPSDMDGVTGIGLDGAGDVYVSGPGADQAGNIVSQITKVLAADGSIVWSRTVSIGDVPFAYPVSMTVDPIAGRIYVATADTDSFSAPTMWRGTLLGMDLSGNVVLTRTSTMGQQLIYWDVVKSTTANIVVLSGSVGPTLNPGGQGGIDGGGFADMIVHAWDVTDPCWSPAWSVQYDSGAGDDMGPAIAAVSGGVIVACDTPNQISLRKYQEGSPSGVAFSGTVGTVPGAPLMVGAPVAIYCTVTNTGSRSALALSATGMVNSGGAALAPLLGPWVSAAGDLLGGTSRTWWWTSTVTGAGTFIFSLTVTGIDACTAGSVSTVPGGAFQTGYRSKLMAALAITRTINGIGDWVKVDLTVTNEGSGAAQMNGVTATIFVTNGASAVSRVAGDVQSAVSLGAGGSNTFSWTYSVSGVATPALAFNVVSYGNDVIFGYMSNTASGSAQTVDQARLAVTLPPSGTTSVGGVITYVAAVTNLGSYAATGVRPDIILATGGGTMDISAPVPAGPLTIQPGGTTLFVWTCTATGAGAGIFTVTVTGGDTSPLGYPLSVRESGWGRIQTPASLEAYMVFFPTTIEVGQVVTATVTLTNTGQAAAVGLSSTMGQFGSGGLEYQGTTPALSSTILGGQSITYTTTLTGGTAGTYYTTQTITGQDVNTGKSVSVSYTSNMVNILSAPALDATLTAYRAGGGAQAHIGQSFLAMLTVTNTGGVTAAGVRPVGFSVSGSGAAAVAAGPTPAGPQTLAGGASVTFTWTLAGSLQGSVWLSNSVTGISALSGSTTFSGVAVSNPVTIQRLLTSWATATPATVNGGQNSLIAMTISNTGASTAAVITPGLNIIPSASATAVGPSATNLTLSPGQGVVVTWTMTGLAAANASVTAYATAVDALDTSYPVVTGASVSVLVNSSMAAHMVVTPATSVVAGGSFKVELTVTNWGGVLMQNLTPSIILNPGGLAVVGPPVPGLVGALSTGNSATFTWTGSGKAAGMLTITVMAAGTPFSGSYDSVTRAYVLEVKSGTAAPRPVVPAFEGDAIVYPNPVGGDLVKVAVRLEADATLIEMDVYNTGYQRVWSGEFPGAAAGDWPLEVNGVSKWAPGIYLVRIRATLANGSTKVFPTLRIGVKRK